MSPIISGKDFRQLFDVTFDDIEKDFTRNNVNHHLTAIDNVVQKTIEFFTKEYGQRQERIEQLEAECKSLEKDNEKYHQLYVDLKRQMEIKKQPVVIVEDFQSLRNIKF